MTWQLIAERQFRGNIRVEVDGNEHTKGKYWRLPKWRSIRGAPISIAGARFLVVEDRAYMATRRTVEEIDGKTFVTERLLFMAKGAA